MACCCCSSILLFFIALIGAIRFYMKWTMGIYKGKERLEGKTVIVTGANSGIGLESAKDFAQRGARVIMLCRDMAKAEKVKNDIYLDTGNSQLILKNVDFSSLKSIRECAKQILAEESRIDILLNNAGAGGIGFREYTEDGLDLLMQTNHFGPFLLTNLLLGKIKQSTPGRIVNVSSLAHKWANLDLDHLDQTDIRNRTTVYSNSKLANIYFTTVLAEKLRGTGITVNSLHPGVIATDIARNRNIITRYMWNIIGNNIFKNSWEGAQTSIYLCVSPSVEKVTGKYFSDCKEVPTSKEADDYQKALKLWHLSEKAVKLQSNEKFL